MKNGPIGQYLLEKGLITEEQLNEILEIKKNVADNAETPAEPLSTEKQNKILFVGNIIKRKNVDLLIEAKKQLKTDVDK